MCLVPVAPLRRSLGGRGAHTRSEKVFFVERDVKVRNNESMYGYLVGSACYWNHPMESAQFRFYISEESFDSGAEGFDIHREDGYVVASREYHTWTPDSVGKHISISWDQEVSNDRSTVVASFLITVCVITIVGGLAAMIIIQGIRPDKKRAPLGQEEPQDPDDYDLYPDEEEH